MASPGLLHTNSYGEQLVSDTWCDSIIHANAGKLQQLDKDPAPLQAWLTTHHSHRLGVYFETLLGYWLKQLLKAEIYHHNIAVFRQQMDSSGRQTIGEFDFLFRLPGEVYSHHWEAAVKFYLQHRDGDGVIRWYGPAASDRLDIKLDRLFGHQLQLATSPEGRAVLENCGLGAVKSAAFVKGYLFYPYEHWQGDFSEELLISHRHLRGWWLYLDDLPSLKISLRNRWVLLRRHQWLAPVVLHDYVSASLLDESALMAQCREHFLQSNKALLFAEVTPCENTWIEINRGFVVSDRWPDTEKLADM